MRKSNSKKLEPQAPAKRETVTRAFGKLWADLFSSPVHLDSALSKQPKNLKSILARSIPAILLRPASQAEAMGVGVPAGEPWCLPSEQLKAWRPAAVLAERMYEGMIHRPQRAQPVRDDFPPRMVEEWGKEWGNDRATELVRVLGSEAPLSLRVARAFGAGEVLRGLKEGRALPVSSRLSDLSPAGIRLDGYAPVLATELHARGAFEIQDEGSQVMALFSLWPELFAGMLSDAPGPVRPPSKPAVLPEIPPAWTIVDACAGAGGKSLAIADALRGKGRVFSYDTSEKKLQALRRRARLAGLRNIQGVVVKDGEEAQTLRRFRKSAQVVLVDAPCSGWGVLRRNPDIKWRQVAGAVERMPGIQLRLLSTYSDIVAPGGRLVFGVCTFRRAETRDVVEAFLGKHREFRAREGGYLGPGPCDGFFMQSFERS